MNYRDELLNNFSVSKCSNQDENNANKMAVVLKNSVNLIKRLGSFQSSSSIYPKSTKIKFYKVYL